MRLETELKKLNISEGCNKKCEDCERYFECILPFKEYFQQKGILGLIRENLKNVSIRSSFLAVREAWASRCWQ